MPSPIAHAGVYLLLRHAAPTGVLRQRPRWRRLAFVGLCLFALVAPDFDFIVSAMLADNARAEHGLFMHSFVAALVFAPLWGAAARWLIGGPWLRMAAIGLAAYASHIVMDYFTRGRGVALFWPVYPERLSGPPLFYGIRHSELGAIGAHAITLTTELLFVGLLWLVSCWWSRRGEAGRPLGEAPA